MRRTITLLTALALVFAASCQRIEETTVQDGSVSDEQITIEATIAETNPSAAVPGDELQTKTALQENGVDIWWTPGDAINLFYGTANAGKFQTTLSEPAAVTEFSGTISVATGSSNVGMAAQSFWGVYPYDAENTCDGSSVTLKILGTQVASPGSFGKGMNPSVANSPGLGLSFYNVGSWFRFSVTQEGITSATFSGNAGEILAGKVTVTMDSDKKPLITNVADGVTSITVTPEGGGSFVPGKHYYITVIPQAIAATGYTLTLNKGGQSAECVVSKESGTYVFARSGFRSKADADKGLTWKNDYVEMAPGFNWAKMNVGATAPEGYGDYFAWGETSPKDSYSESNYDYLLPFSDAATANWGEDWRTPTIAEWEALLNTNKYTWEWTTENGVNGYRITSKVSGYVGNSIFLPADHDSSGIYWSSTISGSDTFWANSFYYTASDLYKSSSFRYELHVIRAIYDPSSVPPVSPDIPVTGVSFEIGNYAVLNGDTFALTATIAPTSATIQELTWVSSNHSVAIVSPTGVVTGKKIGTTTITARTVDGGYTASCDVTVIPNASYVDMGNGTKWATKNVGADSPEEWGGFYAWGETQTKTSYTWSTYRYGSSSSNVTIYTATDGKTVLEAGDDAATVNLGSNWRMATDAEWTWLLENCTWTYAEMNGNKGYIVKSNVSGNSSSIIFLPGAGIHLNSHGNTDRCYYWSANVSTDTYSKAKYAVIYEGGGRSIKEQYRCYGASVRPIYEPQQFINGHEYVEMGDGLKWATMNVGATKPEEYGDYFAWGETAAKTDYSWSTYFDNPSGDGKTFTKYATDKKTVLDLEDDAARQIWKGTWRIPTDAEWTALRNADNFKWTWTDDYEGTGVDGRIVTSKVSGYEGNSIFLPAAGYRYGPSLYDAGSRGNYWSSSLNTSYSSSAWDVGFGSSSVSRGSDGRYFGPSVRPVSE